MRVTFNLNNEKISIEVDPRQTLLDTLREDLELTGTKKGVWKRGMWSLHCFY